MEVRGSGGGWCGCGMDGVDLGVLRVCVFEKACRSNMWMSREAELLTEVQAEEGPSVEPEIMG